MTDYICPKCGCGFSEEAGKKRTSPPWKDKDMDRLTRWALMMMDAIAMRTYYGIVCPDCGHIFGDDADRTTQDEWAFDVDDIIVSEDAPDVAPQHNRVRRRLTDEDGERYYHLGIRLKSMNGWTENYGDWLAPAEKIDGRYRHASE